MRRQGDVRFMRYEGSVRQPFFRSIKISSPKSKIPLDCVAATRFMIPPAGKDVKQQNRGAAVPGSSPINPNLKVHFKL